MSVEYEVKLSDHLEIIENILDEIYENSKILKKAEKHHKKFSKEKRCNNKSPWDESERSPSKYIKGLIYKEKNLYTELAKSKFAVANLRDILAGEVVKYPSLDKASVTKVVRKASTQVTTSSFQKKEFARKFIIEEVGRVTTHKESDDIAMHINECLKAKYGSKLWSNVLASLANEYLFDSLREKDIKVYLESGTYKGKQLNSALYTLMEAYSVVKQIDTDATLERLENKIDTIKYKAIKTKDKVDTVIKLAKSQLASTGKINISEINRNTRIDRKTIRKYLKFEGLIE